MAASEFFAVIVLFIPKYSFKKDKNISYDNVLETEHTFVNLLCVIWNLFLKDTQRDKQRTKKTPAFTKSMDTDICVFDRYIKPTFYKRFLN